ncbi:hypothetical protein [Xanthomarina sp. F2636L]|uniref:hypothetical protein n=1 Tax=Xanthomarina sp. F2636L TaxID=2996018 RepID=UPI00225DEF5D|nr:hypothetical protein [Xanthomarina sp. F2636L]MCX7551887.1 hypothetical protein [Xanthomarina sp. F2636L]
MIRAKLLFIEEELKKQPVQNLEFLEALYTIKNLINQIDFSAEVVPVEDIKKVNKLFKSLKKDSLTKTEKLIIKQLVKN